MWINESEIDQALDLVERHKQEYLPYVRFLSDWRDIVNRNSDGWAYWRGGTKPASKLMELIDQLVKALRGGYKAEIPPMEEFDRALTPIRSAATRRKLPSPVLGETYEDAIKDDMEFVSWVEETLIPDLKDSGTVETAADFERLIRIIRKLSG